MKFNAELAEKYLMDMGLLKFGGDFNVEGKSPLEIVKTVLLNSKSSSTYKENGIFHCGVYHYRTISDLFRLCKSYIPDLSLTQLYEFLIELGNDPHIVSHICHSAHKRMYGYFHYMSSHGFNTQDSDEYGYEFPLYKDRSDAGHTYKNFDYPDKRDFSIHPENYQS